MAAALALLAAGTGCTSGQRESAKPATAPSAQVTGPAATQPAPEPPAVAGSEAAPEAVEATDSPTPADPAPADRSPAPAASEPASAGATATAQPRAAGPLPTTFGAGPVWPKAARSPAPPAYGAVVTRRRAGITTGGTLAGGLLLPRLDTHPRTPLVMTPCGRRVRLRTADVSLVPPGPGGRLPKPANRVLALIDPGHGGAQAGAIGVDGSREADRDLKLAREVAELADARLGRVYLTRNRDMEATLEFRVALGDSLRADVAVSVHLNAQADAHLERPGVETFGSVSDPQGRRLAGVMYEAQRRFLQQYPGPWVGYRDAGAKYRLGRSGRDYYGLLRRAHVPWVISESLFMTSAHDLALLDQPKFATGLATTIADATTAFATTRTPGSGWVKPLTRADGPPPPPRPAKVPQPPAPKRECVDPAR